MRTVFFFFVGNLFGSNTLVKSTTTTGAGGGVATTAGATTAAAVTVNVTSISAPTVEVNNSTGGTGPNGGTASEPSDGGLSVGIITGIVVAGLLVAILGTVLAVYFICNIKRQPKDEQDALKQKDQQLSPRANKVGKPDDQA
mmetsp:Transcript_111037/g.220886  ORF Transcript_111037/g.220886 Transcript_111037/m.220886 type:complete len:142 (-) Transcript_111037:151-576(-)